MITRLKSSSVSQGLPKYRSLLAGNDTYYPSVYESIATVSVGSGGSSTITFSSIPSTYTHLQIRAIARATDSGTGSIGSLLKFNSDTTSNYRYHLIEGTGSSVISTASGQIDFIDVIERPRAGETASAYGPMVIDILDYTNTNKYKTIRSLSGFDGNGSGKVDFFSGVWMSTSAITQIDITNGTFTQYSRFALYGIKVSY